MTDERRRSPRVELLQTIRSPSLIVEGEVEVREMSLGGMAVATSFALDVGTVRIFRLTLGDGAKVELVGKVRHCRDIASAGQPAHYLSGVEFVDDEPSDGQDAVRNIIDRQA